MASSLMLIDELVMVSSLAIFHDDSLMLIIMHLTDVNECSNGIHSCQQVCNNTQGSHHCLCFDGYELNSDSYSCAG